MRRIAAYTLVMIVGLMMAFGISQFIGIAYPQTTWPVFAVICVWWLFTTWRYWHKRAPTPDI